MLRWPKGTVGAEADAVGRLGGMDVLATPADGAARTSSCSAPARWPSPASRSRERLRGQGIGVTVVDPRWVKPVDPAVIDAAREHRLVAVVEDNGRAGGFGDAVSRLLRDHDVDVPVKTFGLPQEFLTHGSRDEILEAARAEPAAPGQAAHRGGRAPHARVRRRRAADAAE